MTETADILRIIASERARLDAADRAAIIRAAEELEWAIRSTLDADRALIEANAHNAALNDQLRDLRKKLPLPPVDDLPWSMSTGWINCEVMS